MTKSYEEINEKIRKGKAVVLTAEEVSEMARTMKPKEIIEILNERLNASKKG